MAWDNKPTCPYCGYYHREFSPEKPPEDDEDIVIKCKYCDCEFTAKCCIAINYLTKPIKVPDDGP